MFCPSCGSEIGEGLKFCTQCGTPLENAAPAAPVEPEFTAEAPAYEAAPAYDAAPEYTQGYTATPVYDAEPVNPVGAEPTDPGAGMGKISKILGIVGIITSCCGFGFALSVVSLILGIIGAKKSEEAGFENASAKTGKILGIVGIVIGAIVCVIAFIGSFASTMGMSSGGYYY